MVSDVELVKVGDHCTVVSGFAFKSKDLGNFGIPVIKIKNVNNKIVDISDTQFFPKELISEKHDKFFVENGDVLIAMTGQGSVGRVGRLKNNYGRKILLNQRVGKFSVKPSLDLGFLYYVLSSDKYENILFNAAIGSGQPNLSPSDIYNIEIPYLNIKEQKAIAHILGSLDDKIELNRQMNETLEAMAQALFKSWFVDFDPVLDNALAAGNPIPDELSARAEQRQALPPSDTDNHVIRELFPDAFEFTEEMGWIPEGWAVGKYSDLAALNPESWNKKNMPEEISYVDLGNTNNGKIDLVVAYSSSEAPSRAKRVLSVDDTVIGTVRPGNRSFAFIHNKGLTGSTGFAVMRPLEHINRSYIYLGLTQDIVIDYLAHIADGGAYPAINPSVVADLECIIPPSEILEKFDNLAYCFMKKIGVNHNHNETLAKLRDTLLPKLLSGELRITDAAAMVDEV